MLDWMQNRIRVYSDNRIVDLYEKIERRRNGVYANSLYTNYYAKGGLNKEPSPLKQATYEPKKEN